MPLYEYQCEACGHTSEELQRLSDDPLTVCPSCGGPYKKLLSAPAFQFKGSGWYITDYARKNQGKSDDGGSGGDSAKSAGTDGGSTSKSKTESSKASSGDS